MITDYRQITNVILVCVKVPKTIKPLAIEIKRQLLNLISVSLFASTGRRAVPKFNEDTFCVQADSVFIN